MAYTNIPSFTANQLLTSTVMNQILGNINFGINGRLVLPSSYYGSGNKTTASTSWSDTDATNHKISVTSAFMTGRLYFEFIFLAGVTYNDGLNNAQPYRGLFDVILDSTTYYSSKTSTPNTWGMLTLQSGTTGAAPIYANYPGLTQVKLSGIFTGLSSGTHDLKLRFKVNQTTATATVYNEAIAPVHMLAMEV